MKTFEIIFTVKFRGKIEAESDDDADRKADALTTGDVWDDSDWVLDDSGAEIVDSWASSDQGDEDDGGADR